MTEALPLRLAYPFLIKNGLEKEEEEIRTSTDKIGTRTSSLKRARIVILLQEKNLFDKFLEEAWLEGKTEKGKRKTKQYENLYDRVYGKKSTIIEEEEEDFAFGREADLQNFLVKNLHVIEPDLRFEGSEYSLNTPSGHHRYIDILAFDKEGVPVLIELKVSRGHEKTVGQVLLYRNLLKRQLNIDNVRVFIIADKISEELQLAIEDLSFIELREYQMKFSLNEP